MKKRLVSAITASGTLHIGNYIGAVKQFVELQEDFDMFVFVADLHAITVPQNPSELRQKTLDIARVYLAAGLDPQKCTLFVQSQVPAHTELQWTLNTIARMGDMEKMTQFKDKAGIQEGKKLGLGEIAKRMKEGTWDAEEYGKEKIEYAILEYFNNEKRERASVGLFGYPVLMAADILLYDAALVPVGEDQIQHIELTRTLGRRFNDRFGETFVVPEAKIQKAGARIMALDDPTKKMSKSASSVYNYIALTDDAETITKKIKKAVTDSGSEILYSEEKPALKNLIDIYSLFDNKTPEEVVSAYVGKGYGDFKAGLTEVLVRELGIFQEKLAFWDDEKVMAVLQKGRARAQQEAVAKIQKVYEQVGFLAA